MQQKCMSVYTKVVAFVYFLLILFIVESRCSWYYLLICNNLFLTNICSMENILQL